MTILQANLLASLLEKPYSGRFCLGSILKSISRVQGRLKTERPSDRMIRLSMEQSTPRGIKPW